MAFREMYPGLQQKAIDGVELVYNNIPGGKFYEVLKFANETKHIMLINFEVVSAKWFDSLPKDMQDILVEECDKAGEATSRKIFELEAQVEQDLKKRGMTVVEDVDLAAFRKAGERAYEVLKIQDAKPPGPQGDRQVTRGKAGQDPFRGKRAGLLTKRSGPFSIKRVRPLMEAPLFAVLCARRALIAGTFLVLMVLLIFLGGVMRDARLSDQLVGRRRDRVLRLGLLPLRRHRLAAQQPDGDRGPARRLPARRVGAALDQLRDHQRLPRLPDRDGAWLAWISRVRSFQGIPEISYSWVTTSCRSARFCC